MREEGKSNSRSMKPRVVVIGGGAAGYMAAIQASKSKKFDVTILEATSNVLTKVRRSGGGRCNVMHDPRIGNSAIVDMGYYRGRNQMHKLTSIFGVSDTYDFFTGLGVSLKTESDGRVFPTSDDSATIINALTTAANTNKVELQLNANVGGISKGTSGFTVEYGSARLGLSGTIDCEKLIVCPGSSVPLWKLVQSLRHGISKPVPSLFTFNSTAPVLKDLAGVSSKHVKVSFSCGKFAMESEGPILITHVGISGPAVLKLSSIGARHLSELGYKFNATIDFAPTMEYDELVYVLTECKGLFPRRQIGKFFPSTVLSACDVSKRLWNNILDEEARINSKETWATVNEGSIMAIAKALKSCTIPVRGKTTFKEEFVTCGGISWEHESTPQINTKTMESMNVPGLYFAGEFVDTDGITGGFNFQNAWSTGWVAGTNAVKRRRVKR